MLRYSRLAYLPKAVFGRLNEKFHTPVANLVITGIVGLIAIFLDVATSTSFINFCAFTAFTPVNVSVVFHYVRQRRAGQQLNAVSYVVVPVIGAVICAYLLSQLDSNAITARGVLAGAGHRGPGPDHPWLQGGAARDDGHREGDGRGGRLTLFSW